MHAYAEYKHKQPEIQVHKDVCVCVVCVYVCNHPHVSALCGYSCNYVLGHFTCTCSYMHTYIDRHMRYIQLHYITCLHMHAYVLTNLCIHTHVLAYLHTCMHARMHAPTDTRGRTGGETDRHTERPACMHACSETCLPRVAKDDNASPTKCSGFSRLTQICPTAKNQAQSNGICDVNNVF